MSQIASPWLAQLKERRPFALETDTTADVTIVGAGIAGVSTAAAILQETDLSVLLLDAGRIAHGASGHNAGQLVADFERPLPDLIAAYGLRNAVRAQTEVEGAWGHIDDLFGAFSLRTPLHKCQGFAGFTTAEQIRSHLDSAALRSQVGLFREPLLIAVGTEAERVLTLADEPFVVRLPHSVVLKLLRTDDPSFVAAATSPKGCMNSALFCEELAGSLLSAYPGRFRIAEHLPVREVSLVGSGALLSTDGPSITTSRVVLCTNGFENVTLKNEEGPAIDRSFHRMIYGIVGYMGGYLGQPNASAVAVSYFRDQRSHIDPYMYLTRRPYEREGNRHTLLCLGGPERFLPEGAEYDPHAAFPADVEEEIERSFTATYRHGDDVAPERAFLWHGVMGYTPTGIRCVGQDPRSPALYYNLGCNGVGILPSVAGAQRIARLLNDVELPPSLFDPGVQMGE